MNSSSATPQTWLRATLIATVVYGVFLLVVGFSVSMDTLKIVFGETGPFETLSMVFWLVMGLAGLIAYGPGNRMGIAIPLAGLFAAAREADLHKRFTTDGMTKINYYLNDQIPIYEKAVAATVLACAVFALLYLVYQGYRFTLKQSGFKKPSGLVLTLAVGLLVSTKIVDRLPAHLDEWFDIQLGEWAVRLTTLFEEGYEMAIPLLFVAVIFIRTLERKQPDKKLSKPH